VKPQIPNFRLCNRTSDFVNDTSLDKACSPGQADIARPTSVEISLNGLQELEMAFLLRYGIQGAQRSFDCFWGLNIIQPLSMNQE